MVYRLVPDTGTDDIHDSTFSLSQLDLKGHRVVFASLSFFQITSEEGPRLR